MSRAIPCSLLALLALASAKSVAGAEEPLAGVSPTQGATIEVVVTGTKTVETAARSPVRVEVVTRDEAMRRGATNVGEALAGELGLEVNPAAYGSIGSPSAAQVGGLDRERVLVLVDGERVAGDVGGAVDLSELSLAGVERLEVVRGPTSALYGSSAIGGVINIVSGPPEIEGWSGRARLEGRHRWGGIASAEAAYRKDDTWIAAEASFYGSEGVSLHPPDRALPDTYRLSVGLRGGVRLGRQSEADASLRYGREAGMGLDAQEVPGLGTFLVDLPDVTDRFSARLRDRLILSKGNELRLSVAKQWFWNRTANDRRDSPIDDQRDRFHTMHSIEIVGSFLEGERISLLTGVRGEAENFDQSLRKTTLSSGALTETTLEEVRPTTLGSGATYAQLRVDPWQSFSALLGGRVEASPRYGVAAAPRLALAVRPIDSLVFRVSAGRGYRAPSAKEIGFVFDHSVYGYRVIGNDELLPEASWGFQADVEWKPVRSLRLRGGGFANWISDLIDLRLASARSGIAGVDDYTYVNVGAARTSGADVRIDVRASPWIRAEAGYSYLFTRDEEMQRPLPGRPPHTLLVSASAETPIRLSFYARMRGVLDAYIDDTTRAPGFVTLDLRVSKGLWPGAEAYAGALNVLGAQKDPAISGDQRPIEGRTFSLGVSTELPAKEVP